MCPSHLEYTYAISMFCIKSMQQILTHSKGGPGIFMKLNVLESHSNNLSLLYLTHLSLLPSGRSAHRLRLNNLSCMFSLWFGGPILSLFAALFHLELIATKQSQIPLHRYQPQWLRMRVASCPAAPAQTSTWCPMHEVLQSSPQLGKRRMPGIPLLCSSFVMANAGIPSWSVTVSCLTLFVRSIWISV